ncbi:MAG: DUF3021 domain-containing protein [Clostridia bacterium]|nr:DUF3021 domain-containing protein [Clostridia bacterium]
MKKKILFRCLLGAPIGLAISTVITVIISLCLGKGEYYAVVPELISDCGNEIKAVTVQTVCSLVFGAACGGASAIWSSEKLNLLLQTVTHFVVLSVSTFPLAFFMYWMPHTELGILSYFGIFILIYVCIWIGLYFYNKMKIKEMNNRLQENEQKNA